MAHQRGGYLAGANQCAFSSAFPRRRGGDAMFIEGSFSWDKESERTSLEWPPLMSPDSAAAVTVASGSNQDEPHAQVVAPAMARTIGEGPETDAIVTSNRGEAVPFDRDESAQVD